MTQTFESGGFTLAYDDINPAAKSAILLVHGFSTNRTENWRRTGWYGLFERQGRRIIALDCRGHGDSAKSHDPGDYGDRAMARDLFALLDHLGIARIDALGFSMGSRLLLRAALIDQERFDMLALSGIGERMFQSEGDPAPMVAAMSAADPATIADPLMRSFRLFADLQNEDREALSAFVRGERWRLAPGDLAPITRETLVLAGALDTLAGSPEGLARAIPGAKAVRVPGCDHSAVLTNALFKAAVMDFLEGWED